MSKKKIKKRLLELSEEVERLRQATVNVGVKSSGYGTALLGLDRRLKALETYNQRLFDLEKEIASLKRCHSNANHP